MNELGELRPSQLIYTFGVGALVDLPYTSVLIMGLDDWDTRYCTEITEERLLAAVQKRCGKQVRRLYLPPIAYDDERRDPTAPAKGVPVAPFPRWLRCPLCDALATIESGVFKLEQDRWRPDRTRYVHTSCPKSSGNPTALPVRFLLACREGHLTDFPWVDYVHRAVVPCRPARLSLREFGAAGDASDIIVKCLECGVERRMGEAFERDATRPIRCPGHHPHLRTVEAEGCKEEARTILLGASNSWFPLVMSSLWIPRAQDRLGRLVEENWAHLKDFPSLEVAKFNTAPSRMPVFADFSGDEIWAAIQGKKQGEEATQAEDIDLKVAEWSVLVQNPPPAPVKDFRMRRVEPPSGFTEIFEDTVLLEELREVRALLAFTRIESKGDFADAAYADDGRQTALCRKSPEWLPASEVRGEGIFLRFREEVLQEWERSTTAQMLEGEFMAAHRAWRRLRNLKPPEGAFPGVRYVLMHSLSHALMRQIVIECGYTAASVRERLYCRAVGQEHGPTAGIMIYTAATDSEGTLGGLVQLGEPVALGRHVQQGLWAVRLCASDPLCAEHSAVGDGRCIHGAACHACLFAPETSCERGNRYLDRNALVETFAGRAMEFFK